jgi:hypothetical protein
MLDILGYKENANQKDIDFTSYQSEWLPSIIHTTTNAGKEKTKNRTTVWFSHTIPGHIPEGICSRM